MIVVAEVTTTQIKENKDIEEGSPMDCPFTCACWLAAYLVKSGILSERVAQKPTMPVSPGIKKAQKAAAEANPEGRVRMGPRPPCTAEMAQYNKASAARGRKKALNTNNFRMLLTPIQTTHIFNNQNKIKQMAGPVGNPQEAGNMGGRVARAGIHRRSIW